MLSFSKKRVGRPVSMANLRKEMDEIFSKAIKDFEKSVDHLKPNDEVKQFVKKANTYYERIKQNVLQKLDNKNFLADLGQLRREFNQLLDKVSDNFEKELEDLKLSERTIDLKSKWKSCFTVIIESISEKLEELHVKDEVVKLRIEVERLLSEASTDFEKIHEKYKDTDYIKSVFKGFRKITENTSKEVGTRFETFNNGETDLRKDIIDIVTRMTTDFENFARTVKENEKVQEMTQQVKLLSDKVSERCVAKLDAMKLKLSGFEQVVVKGDQEANKIIETLKGKSEIVTEKISNAQSFVSNYYATMRQNAVEPINNSEKPEKKLSQEHLLSSEISNGNNLVQLQKRKQKKINTFFMLKIIDQIKFWIIFIIFKAVPVLICNFFSLFYPKDVKNYVVVITGAGNGLGKALAERFVKLGARVACVDINSTDNETCAQHLRKDNPEADIKTYSCDISKAQDVRKTTADIVRDFGKVDILVNNAGIVCCHKITEGSDASIQRVFEVNLISNFWMVRAFLPKMIQQRSGHIVFINSESGIHGLPLSSSYASAKFGLLGLAYSLEGELRRDPDLKHIKISSVHPMYFASRPEMAHKVDLKTPLMSVESVADLAVHGIRRELFVFCIPMVYGGFLVSSLIRLLPPALYELVVRHFIGGVKDTAKPAFRDPIAAKE